MSAANTAVLIEIVGAVDSGGGTTNLILGGAVDHSPHGMDTVGELPGVWTTPSGMDNVGEFTGVCNHPSGMDNIGGFLRSGSPPVEWTILGLPGVWITLSGMDNVGGLPEVWFTPSGMDNIGGGCSARLWLRFFDEFCCCYC